MCEQRLFVCRCLRNKLGLACKTSKALESFVIFSLVPAIRDYASCSQLHEFYGCKKICKELFGSASQEPSDAPDYSRTRLQIV